MDKSHAILLLGGSVENAARWLRVPPAAIESWPEVMHPTMNDRCITAIQRRDLARVLGITTAKAYWADYRNELLYEATFQRVSYAAVMANLQLPLPVDYQRRPAANETTPTRNGIGGTDE